MFQVPFVFRLFQVFTSWGRSTVIIRTLELCVVAFLKFVRQRINFLVLKITYISKYHKTCIINVCLDCLWSLINYFLPLHFAVFSSFWLLFLGFWVGWIFLSLRPSRRAGALAWICTVKRHCFSSVINLYCLSATWKLSLGETEVIKNQSSSWNCIVYIGSCPVEGW